MSFHSNYFHRVSVEILKRRDALYRATRSFFSESGFLETTTPTLSRDVCVDRFVRSIPVEIETCWTEPDSFFETRFDSKDVSQIKRSTFYLQTSPEFCMKRLVASGAKAIYQICPAFRQGDRGSLHNVEFTMLEWYKTGVDYKSGQLFLADVLVKIAAAFARTLNSRAPMFFNNVDIASYGEVFYEKTRLDPHECSRDDLLALANQRQIPYPASYVDPNSPTTKDDWLDLIFSELIQPDLGRESAIILYDYPASQAQLAKTREVVDPRTKRARLVTQRYEAFAKGVELANGYYELLDADVLRSRIAKISDERRRDGSPELPKESRLLAAMDEGLPECSGCALGLDRFLMILLGKETIDDVVPFPVELA